MFWKKKTVEAGTPATKVEPSKKKVKPLSPREIMRQQIEQLAPGEVLKYRFPETFGGNLAVIELNPQYPQKGHKYILSSDKLIDDKPTDRKSRLFDYDNPKGLASWVIERMGQPFTAAEK